MTNGGQSPVSSQGQGQRPKETTGRPLKKLPESDRQLVVALVIWASGIFLSPFLTGFLAYSVSSWWLWPALRVSWVLIAAMWLSFRIARLVGRTTLAGFTPVALSILLSYAPILDLTRGPLCSAVIVESIERHVMGGFVTHTQWR